MCQHKSTINLANFSANGELGQLFSQARVYNEINAQLNRQLPDTLKALELCLIKNKVATLITDNPAIAFRAKQQLSEIITLLNSIVLTDQVNHIEIKVTANK